MNGRVEQLEIAGGLQPAAPADISCSTRALWITRTPGRRSAMSACKLTWHKENVPCHPHGCTGKLKCWRNQAAGGDVIPDADWTSRKTSRSRENGQPAGKGGTVQSFRPLCDESRGRLFRRLLHNYKVVDQEIMCQNTSRFWKLFDFLFFDFFCPRVS